jgi:hypothetical protein
MIAPPRLAVPALNRGNSDLDGLLDFDLKRLRLHRSRLPGALGKVLVDALFFQGFFV